MRERADICRQITTDEKIVQDIKADIAKWQARRAAQPQKKKVVIKKQPIVQSMKKPVARNAIKKADRLPVVAQMGGPLASNGCAAGRAALVSAAISFQYSPALCRCVQ